jgi:glucokinase
MKRAVLAVDLGGTNLRMSAVSDAGDILAHSRTPTPENCDPPMLLSAMSKLEAECRSALGPEFEVAALGVGAPANIGPQHGVLRDLPNLRQLEGMDLKADLVDRFKIPVTLENDATAAAIGENWLGASRTVSDSIMITLGTGVGGGVILNNQPVRGIDGTAGKVGHMCVEPDGYPCKCGSHGCIEQYASATAIVRLAVESGMQVSSSAEVYEASMSGDAKAKAVFERMGRLLGITLGSLANLLNPQMFIIGGGAAAGWDAFIDQVRSELHARAFSEPANRAVIVRSELGGDAGILGAAKSALDLLPS